MLLRLCFRRLYLNKRVLARFRHGLLHLSCSRSSWWLPNPEATTGPGLGDAAMRKLLRLKEVSELTGISRSRILRLVSEGKFVKPTHADLPIMTAWVSSNIEEWIEKQIEKGRGQEPPS